MQAASLSKLQIQFATKQELSNEDGNENAHRGQYRNRAPTKRNCSALPRTVMENTPVNHSASISNDEPLTQIISAIEVNLVISMSDEPIVRRIKRSHPVATPVSGHKAHTFSWEYAP